MNVSVMGGFQAHGWKNWRMTTETLNQHIEITPGISGGKPRIAGHRISVENIVIWHERMGKTADEIASDYDMTMADVYAALAYYFDHREEIDQSLEESGEFVNALRQQSSSKLQKNFETVPNMAKIKPSTPQDTGGLRPVHGRARSNAADAASTVPSSNFRPII